MAQQYIDTGSVPNSVGGESLRSAFDKINDNFSELEDATNPNLAYSLITHFPYSRPVNTNNLWTELSYKDSEAPGTKWTFESFQQEQYFVASNTGSIVEIFIREIPNTDTYVNNADGSDYIFGITLNPPPFSTIADTSFDFTESFDFSLAPSKSLYPSIDVNPGDIVGYGLYKSSSNPQLMAYSTFSFIKFEI